MIMLLISFSKPLFHTHAGPDIIGIWPHIPERESFPPIIAAFRENGIAKRLRG